jgi:hypothetical protein
MNVYMYIVKRNLNCDKCLSCFQEVLHYKATILKSFHLSVCFFHLQLSYMKLYFSIANDIRLDSMFLVEI